MNHKGTKDTEEDRRPKKKEDASQLTIDHHLFYFLIFNYLLPITDYPLPITHYRLPITQYIDVPSWKK